MSPSAPPRRTGPSQADSVYLGGRVRTMADDGDGATAFACRDGRFLAVGSDSEVRALAGPSTRIVDLGGAAVLPGFIETHLHPFMLGMKAAHVDAGPDACPTIEVLLAALTARADQSDVGDAIIGDGFDDSLVAEDRGLVSADLDRVSTTRPVIVRHLSGHGMYVNSLAMRAAGIDAATPEPIGGTIARDSDGAPSGEFLELPAMRLLGDAAQFFPPGGLDEALRIALRRMASVGVTSFHDMFVSADMLASYQRMRDAGELTLRARAYLGLSVAEDFDAHGGQPPDTELLAVGGVKLISDGSLQLHTGALTEPYHDLGGCHCGEMAIPAGDLAAMVASCHEAGRQVAIHTNGDRAIDLALDAIEAAAATSHKRVSHRLEHVQTLREDQIQRMRALGVAASVFVNHVYYWGDRHRDRFLGPARGARISPLASIAAAGLPFALHCDCPVTPVNPLFTIDTAVNRVTRGGHVLGPEQRVDPATAVAGYTSSAATIAGEESAKGSIEAGKLADFVVLSADPHTCAPTAIKDITVLSTVVGDREVYRPDGGAHGTHAVPPTPSPAELIGVVEGSPAAVAVHDRGAWLALFSKSAEVCDPYGSRPVIGRSRLTAFYQTFIAPNKISFDVDHDVLSGMTVFRDLTLTTLMAGGAALRVPMHLRYDVVVQDATLRIERLHAHWELPSMVGQLLRGGWPGIVESARFGHTLLANLGLWGAVGFMGGFRRAGATGKRTATEYFDSLRDGGAAPSHGVAVEFPGGAGTSDFSSLNWRKLLSAGSTVTATIELRGSRGVALLDFAHGRRRVSRARFFLPH